jgi:hypothetical protein
VAVAVAVAGTLSARAGMATAVAASTVSDLRGMDDSFMTGTGDKARPDGPLSPALSPQ